MYSEDHRDPTAACVEFTFRVHSNGRRERLAVVLVRGRDGVYRPGRGKPSGDLARFVLKRSVRRWKSYRRVIVPTVGMPSLTEA